MAGRGARWLRRGLVAGGVLLAVAVGVVLWLGQSDWAQEQVRTRLTESLEQALDGSVRIGDVSGNLLGTFTLEDVAVEDSLGDVVFSADEITADLSLSDLRGRRVVLNDVELLRPRLVLEQARDGSWNVAGLAATDTMARPDTAGPGLGSWIRASDVEVVDGTVVVRQPWPPPDRPLPADHARYPVETVDGRRVVVRTAEDLDARLEDVVLADPGSGTSGEVTSLTASVRPLEDTTLPVENLEGRFTLRGDSLRLQDVRLELPASRLSGEAMMMLDEGGGLEARIDGDLAGRDLDWLEPSLPKDARLEGEVAVRQREGHTSIDASGLDVRTDGARLRGGGRVVLGDTAMTAGPADLRFEGIEMSLVERLLPGVEVPVEGTAEGTLVLEEAGGDGWGADGGVLEADVTFRPPGNGRPSRLRAEGRVALGAGPAMHDLSLRLDPLDLSLLAALDPALAVPGVLAGTLRLDGPLGGRLSVQGDLTHRSPSSGASRFALEGGVELGDPFAVRDLTVRMDPLRLELVEALAGALPVGGTLEGRATLDGFVPTGLTAAVDVVHRDTTGVSRLVGTVAVEEGAVRADLRAPTLALATLGRFVPAAELRGTASASVEATGTLERLALDARLAPTDRGAVRILGVVDAAAPDRSYDLEATFQGLDAAAVSARAPATDLWGTASVEGRGTDPATLQATVAAELVDSLAGGAVATGDRRRGWVRLRARAARGTLAVEEADVRRASATLTAGGTIGLVPDATGRLTYTLEVDSLSDFASILPPSATAGPPVAARPALQEARIAAARADSIRRAEAAAVERAVTGQRAGAPLNVDTIPTLPRDSLSGRVALSGSMEGSLRSLSAEASGELGEVVVLGHRLGSGQVTLAARNLALAGPGISVNAPSVALEADLQGVRLAGFGFEGVELTLEHHGSLEDGEGTVRASIIQDPQRDYRIMGEYDLALERRTVRLDSLSIRTDTVLWRATNPTAVHWGSAGLDVEDLALVNGVGGRIRIDGRFPAEGAPVAGEEVLTVEVERLQVAEVMALLQDTVEARGLLSLDARVEGSRAAPRVRGTVEVEDLSWRENELPRIGGRIAWADGVLEADAALLGRAGAPSEGPAAVDAGIAAPAGVSEARAPSDTLATLRGTMAMALPGDSLSGPRTLDLTLVADSLPVTAVTSFTPAVTGGGGGLAGEVRVQGTLDEPRMTGSFRLDVSSLGITELGVRLADVRGTLTMDGATISLDSLTARSGGGTLVAGGIVELDGAEGPTADLTLRSRGAIVVDNDLASGLMADADLDVAGPLTSLRVTGTARIREGVFFVEVERTSALDLEGGAAQRAIEAEDVAEDILPRRNPVMEGLRADVALRVDRNTWVRTTQGTAEIYTPEDGAPLAVRYDRSELLPSLDGVLHADRGEWTFAGRRFEITTGTATFLRTTELDPQLQLTAVHEVTRSGQDPLEIQITVGGRLQAPSITLTSDAQPPLPETDLLSYLVFGSSAGSLMRVGGSGLAGVGAGELGALASQQLASLALGSLVERAFSGVETRPSRYGLDVLRISATELPEELAFNNYFQNVLRGTQVEAGKYLTNRLFVAARGRPTDEAWPGVRAEYRTPFGLRWTAAWEPRYLPRLPSLGADQTAAQTRALSTFLLWAWRY